MLKKILILKRKEKKRKKNRNDEHLNFLYMLYTDMVSLFFIYYLSFKIFLFTWKEIIQEKDRDISFR